jgi:hypothetical protein
MVEHAAQEVASIITIDDVVGLLAEERQALETATEVMRAIRHER